MAKHYRRQLNDELYSVAQTSDGGYILGGTSKSIISGDKTEGHLAQDMGSKDYFGRESKNVEADIDVFNKQLTVVITGYQIGYSVTEGSDKMEKGIEIDYAITNF